VFGPIVEAGYTYTDGITAQGGGTAATAATLTIGPGITIKGNTGGIGEAYATDSVVNQGMIDANVLNGVVTIGGNWDNAGTMQASSGGTLDLGGAFTTAQLGVVQNNGGTVNLMGTLNNTGATLALTAATGSWNLSGGTVQSGTITGTGGAALLLSGAGGTLSGVTVEGTALEGVPPPGTTDYTSATITRGLTLNGTLDLGSGGGAPTYCHLTFSGTQTLAGSGQIVFGPIVEAGYTYTDGITAQGGGTAATAATLTIGPGITIKGNTGGIGEAYATDSVVNQGMIDAGVSGQTIAIGGAGTLVNGGEFEATNGAILNV